MVSVILIVIFLLCLEQNQTESCFTSHEKKQGMTSKAYGATGPTERCRTCKGTGKITRKDKEVCSTVYTNSLNELILKSSFVHFSWQHS